MYRRISSDDFLALAGAVPWMSYETTTIITGVDEFGFDARPAGLFINADYDQVGYNAYFWSGDDDEPWGLAFTVGATVGGTPSGIVYMFNAGPSLGVGISVRCIQN